MARIEFKDLMKTAAGRDSIAILILANAGDGKSGKDLMNASMDLAQIAKDPDMAAVYARSKVEAVSALYARKVMGAAHGHNPDALFDTILGGTDRARTTVSVATTFANRVIPVKQDVEAGMTCLICDEDAKPSFVRALGDGKFCSATEPDRLFSIVPSWDQTVVITDQADGTTKNGLIWLMKDIPKLEISGPETETETPRP